MKRSSRGIFTLLAFLAFVAGIVPWMIESDVAREVARQRPVVFGRYALGWFSVLALAITPGCWLAALCLWARRTKSHRWVLFRLVAVGFAFVVGIVVVDVTGRIVRKPRYLENTTVEVEGWPQERIAGVLRTRPPHVRFEVRIEDVPVTARSYPEAPPGHPPVDVVLSTDARGYRNAQALERCAIVAIGDSFTEGSRVSDDQSWPALIAKAIGQPVYNLGMSGTNPGDYLAALAKVALPMEPKVAIVMVYEGNDFKGLKSVPEGLGLEDVPAPRAPSLGDRLGDLFYSSPITGGLKRAFRDWFGPINSDAPVPGWEPLAWMPIQLTHANTTTAYAFTPRHMLVHSPSREAWEASPRWRSVIGAMDGMKRLCEENGIRLILALAPSKPHVVLPLVEERIPAAGLHAFARCKKRSGLPDAETFKRELFENLDAIEEGVAAWCASSGVSFVTLTEALRARMRDGEQVYWTYNQHWTAAGQSIAARRILQVLQK